MSTTTFRLAVIAMTLCAFAQRSHAGNQQSNVQGADATFIKQAAIGGMAEVELGRIAADKGQNAAVKEFGRRMVADHSKANEQLKAIAGRIGVPVPDKADAKHQAAINRFSKMATGSAFDVAYAKEMVDDHEEDVGEFEKAEKQVKNPELKKFIADTLPTLKDHLEMAKKMRGAKR